MSKYQAHFDPFVDGESALHGLDARIKVSILIIALVTTALTPDGAWAVFILMTAITLAGILLAEIPATKLFLRSLVLEIPFILMILPIIFSGDGPWLPQFSIGGFVLRISVQGFRRAISILIKSWLSLQISVLITATTQFQDLLTALRFLGLPKVMYTIFMLMWRYLFVLIREVQRMLMARGARSGVDPTVNGKSGGTIAWRARSTGGMAGSLFLRSIERSERVYYAMQSRGFDGEPRVVDVQELSGCQYGVIFLMVILSGSLLWMAYSVY